MESSRCLTMWTCGFCGAEGYCKCMWSIGFCSRGLSSQNVPSYVFCFLQAEAIFSNVTVVDNVTVAEALMVVDQLANITVPTNTSIFPRELNTSNYIITNTVDLLILNFNQGGTTNITAVCSLLWQTYSTNQVVCDLEIHNINIPLLLNSSKECTACA